MAPSVPPSVSLMEAWSRWLDGQSLAGTEPWGLDLIWWGRIGKILQFAGVLSIVAELLGPTRLRAAGSAARRRARLLGSTRRLWTLAYRFAVPGEDRAGDREPREPVVGGYGHTALFAVVVVLWVTLFTRWFDALGNDVADWAEGRACTSCCSASSAWWWGPPT